MPKGCEWGTEGNPAGLTLHPFIYYQMACGARGNEYGEHGIIYYQQLFPSHSLFSCQKSQPYHLEQFLPEAKCLESAASKALQKASKALAPCRLLQGPSRSS